MTSVLAEAVRELAAAMGQPYEVEAEDTGISGGERFVSLGVLEGDAPEGALVLTTEPCWVVRLGVDRHPFVDHIGAMLYLRVLGVRDET